MKKFTKVFFIICLMFALVLSLVACATGTTGKDEQGRYILAAPEISIENNLISWKKNPKTDKYGVKINDEEEIEINRNSYTLLGDKDATVKVRALGDNVDTVSSEYSNEVSYKAKLQLANPQMPTYEIVGDDIVLRWNSIEGTISYQIEQTHTLSDNTSVGNVVRYTSNTNSYTIAKSTFAAPDIYYFRVQAVGDDNYRNSNYSELLSYAVTQTLEAPAPRLGSSNINWNKVDKATNYVIYLEKVVDSGESKRIAVNTVSSGTTKYDEPNFATAIETYKKEMEKQISGTFDITGSYKMYVQAVHSSHPEIYLSSAIDEVKKLEGEGDSATTKDIVFRKPGKVENINLRIDTIGEGDDRKNAEMLYWQEIEGYDKYRVRFYTNEKSLVSEEIDITKDEGATRANITGIFDRNTDHIGKVYNVSISTASKFAEGLLEGEETYWMKDADNKMEYCPKLNELEVEGTGTFKDYYRISTIGGLQYMLEHTKAGNDSNNYYLTKDINGGGSTNCNFYFYQDSVLKGTFDGNNKVISNINIIVESDGAAMHLFKTIESGAVFKNVTFNNITIQTLEGKRYTSVSLVAGTNKGIIDNVHIINSKFQTTCETAGFAITNDGEINHCSLYDTDIIAKGYTEPKDENANTRADETAGTACNVAGIALTNNKIIFNVSIYEAEITATTKFANIKAAGVAVTNNSAASITNSFVRSSLVKAVTSSGSTQMYSIVGGFVAENSGKIKESYLAHNGSTSRAVEANNVANPQSGSQRLSIAGGIVGRMSGGSISKCYVSYASIIAENKASGIVGETTSTFASSDEFVIDNSYVYRITLYDAIQKEMVVNDSSTKIDSAKIQNVYCAKIEQNSSAKTTHATNVSVSNLINQKLDGFVVYLSSASEQPLLKHMMYADRYKATYSNSAKRDNDVYVVIDTNRQDLCPIKYESDLSIYGKKVDVYWRVFTITEGEGESATTYELTLFLPKYITVS